MKNDNDSFKFPMVLKEIVNEFKYKILIFPSIANIILEFSNIEVRDIIFS